MGIVLHDEIPNRPTALAVGLFACTTLDGINN